MDFEARYTVEEKKTNQTEFFGHNDTDTMLDIVCEDGHL